MGVGGGGGGGGGGIPSDYLVSTQLQVWLFCCWDCGCCWAVTISFRRQLPGSQCQSKTSWSVQKVVFVDDIKSISFQ